jgi:hypothetical protein
MVPFSDERWVGQPLSAWEGTGWDDGLCGVHVTVYCAGPITKSQILERFNIDRSERHMIGAHATQTSDVVRPAPPRTLRPSNAPGLSVSIDGA